MCEIKPDFFFILLIWFKLKKNFFSVWIFGNFNSPVIFQHSLVTEIRELVFPEDRSKYDELVYRKGGRDISMEIDRHRVCRTEGMTIKIRCSTGFFSSSFLYLLAPQRKVDSLIHSHELVSGIGLNIQSI
jgi:hypothetical protein